MLKKFIDNIEDYVFVLSGAENKFAIIFDKSKSKSEHEALAKRICKSNFEQVDGLVIVSDENFDNRIYNISV